jgi:hypothetical protein
MTKEEYRKIIEDIFYSRDRDSVKIDKIIQATAFGGGC